MPWYIYLFAGGSTFFIGAILLMLTVLLRARSESRGIKALLIVMLAMSIALIVLAAPALPVWLPAIWSLTIVCWVIAPWVKRRHLEPVTLGALLLTTGLAILIEARYCLRPSPIPGVFSQLYVVGDSVSAGIGIEHGQTWPVLLSNAHHVNVIDLSRAGATLATAQARWAAVTPTDGLVLLEIGGNDMLAHVPAAQFAADLQSLLKKVEGNGRRLIMLELPRFPLGDAYGITQRRLCNAHQVTLIPRRFWVNVVKGPDATVDGIHLTEVGQRRMEEMIWSFVGGNLLEGRPK